MQQALLFILEKIQPSLGKEMSYPYWTDLANRKFYEKIVIFSFLFIFIVLSFDCWFKNLPLSGYGIIFLCLLLVGFTSLGIQREIKEMLVLDVNIAEKNRLFNYIEKRQTKILNDVISGNISNLDYPTSLDEQMRLLLKDIERDFVKTWYANISTNPSFLFDCHLLLEECFFKILARLRCLNWKQLLKSILYVYLNHIQEYKRSLRRAFSCDINLDENKLKMDVEKMYRWTHPASRDDGSLNYYLIKVVEIIILEFASHEFTISLEGSIVINIIARKMLKTLLFNIEDPNWLYLRILSVINYPTYKSFTLDKSYILNEVTLPEPVVDVAPKFRLNSRSTEITSNIFDRTLGSKVFTSKNGNHKKEVLSLPLPTAKPEPNISSVLGNLISSTAAPLLPENASLCYHPLNKMWLSPVSELKQEVTDAFVIPFLQTAADGLKDENHLSRGKPLTRSKSSDAMSPNDDAPPRRDISVGEELSEGAFIHEETGRRLVKTHSFDAGSTGDIPSGDGGDVSPVYEEPEDFATTIAKLRTILQQRESTSTISDNSNVSMESQGTFSKENTFDSGDKAQTQETDSLSPESNVACDIPTDGRPFVNVCIPRTEVHESSNSSSYVLYTIQYDGIYVKQTPENESQLVLQTTIVKRRFQEFLNLQTRLEETPALRPHLKGIKGPSKWMNLPFSAKTDDATTASRRPILEAYIKQLCNKLEISTSPALQEFLAYGSNAATAFTSKHSNSSLQKIDKFLSNKVTGVFNSIKTVLPSFEPTSLLSPALDAKEVKPLLEQNLLQGFLNFGNKPEDYEIALNFVVSEATGNALTDDVRSFLSEKSDCIEDALDVLDSSDWHCEEGECHVLVGGICAWLQFKDITADDDVDKFDSDAPVLTLIIDILCELLDSSDCWVTKEPVIRIVQSLAKNWEEILKDKLKKVDWNRACGNIIRLLRLSLFAQNKIESSELDATIVRDTLRGEIMKILPDVFLHIVGAEVVKAGVELFLGSLQHPSNNRDVILRFIDIILSQLLSCHHLAV